MRLGVVLACATAAVLAAGCGAYEENNDDAAVRVANYFVAAVDRRDGADACTVLAPELQAALAAQAAGDCGAAVRSWFVLWRGGTPRTATLDGPRDSSGADVGSRATVTVAGAKAPELKLARYGSTWRVSEFPPR